MTTAIQSRHQRDIRAVKRDAFQHEALPFDADADREFEIDDEKENILESREAEADDLRDYLPTSAIAAALTIGRERPMTALNMMELFGELANGTDAAVEALAKTRIEHRHAPPAPRYVSQTVNQELLSALEWAAGVMESSTLRDNYTDCINNAHRALNRVQVVMSARKYAKFGMNITEHDALMAMRCYGSGFSRNLAAAWLRSDPHNKKRLRKAFPELLRKYKAVAQQQKVAS